MYRIWARWGIGLIMSVVVFAVLAAMLLNGAGWVRHVIYPLTVFLSQIALAVLVLVLLPLSFIRKTYGVSATGILLVSYVLGVALWVVALLTTYQIWGKVGVTIGLLFMGVGVVPLAIIAMVVNGMWSRCGELLLAIAIMWSIRVYSHYIAQKAVRPQGVRQ